MLTVSIEPQLEPGWPSSPFRASYFFYPRFTSSGEIFAPVFKFTTPALCLWSLDGQILPGWPKIWQAGDKSYPYIKYVIGDIDGNGGEEAFLAWYDRRVTKTFWVLVDLPSGETSEVKEAWDESFFFTSAPALYDIDEDGVPEVFWFEAYDVSCSGVLSEYRVYRLDYPEVDSSVFKFPPPPFVVANAVISSRLALGDFDGDRKVELAFLTPSPDSDTTHCSLLLVDAETLTPEDTIKLRGYLHTFPIAGDLDGDSVPELVAVTFLHFGGDLSEDTTILYAIKPLTGEAWELGRFPYWQMQLPSLGDVDGDGLPEIVSVNILRDNPTYKRLGRLLVIEEGPKKGADTFFVRFRAFESDGSVLFDTLIPNLVGNHEMFFLTGDLDGDGTHDLLVSCPLAYPDDQAISGFSFQEGVLWQVHIPPDTQIPSHSPLTSNMAYPFLWDVDQDGYLEFPGAKLYIDYDELLGPAFLCLWEIPVEDLHLGWPMLYHDPWNTNNYDFWPPQVGVRESASGHTPTLLKPTPKGLLVNSAKAQFAELKVYDVAGRLVYRGKVNLKAGANLIKVPGKGVRVVSLLGERVKVVSD